MIILSIMVFSSFVQAQTATVASQVPSSAGAVRHTQEVLTNTTMRESALDTTKAKTADQNVEITSMGNQAIKNDIYGISSDLMPWLADIGGGDSSAMQKILMEAQSNPEALAKFYERMPANQREKVKAVSQQIESLRNGATSNLQPNP